MLLDNNTEKVIHLARMVDDLNGIDKIRLAIHIFESLGFTTNYDIQSILKLLQEVCLSDLLFSVSDFFLQ